MEVVDVHKKSLCARGYSSLEDWLADESHLYIGRQNRWVPGARRSKWANPFNAKKHGVENILRLYREHVLESKLIGDIHELEGMKLGCWCLDDPAPTEGDELVCHGQILARLLDEHKRGCLSHRG